jgi:hypothetical protein
LEEVELFRLSVERKVWVVKVSDRCFGRGKSGSANAGALVDSWQKGIRVVARAAFAGGGHNGDKAREVLVFGSETIGDPAAHGGAD